jgi:predicted metallopeptidase
MTGLLHHLSNEDIQRTFTNIGQQHVASVVNYNDPEQIVCYIFSIPFIFDRLEDIGNIFPNIIFNYVTYLLVQDVVSFNREFFIRVGRAFPLLKKFSIFNIESEEISNLENSQSYEIAEYPRLIYLDILCANINYLEQFLNEKVTYVPCLEKLKVVYNNLRIVTNNFTREETRRNCAKVTQLLIRIPLVRPKDFYLYFPLL